MLKPGVADFQSTHLIPGRLPEMQPNYSVYHQMLDWLTLLGGMQAVLGATRYRPTIAYLIKCAIARLVCGG